MDETARRGGTLAGKAIKARTQNDYLKGFNRLEEFLCSDACGCFGECTHPNAISCKATYMQRMITSVQKEIEDRDKQW